MRQILLIIALLATANSSAWAQDAEPQVVPGAVIEKVELAGIPEQSLTSELRNDIQKLAGQKYDAQNAEDVAGRIQTELPEYVAAPKTLQGSDANRIRLVFLVGLIPDDDTLGSNINARYPIAAVEIEGVPRSKVSDALYSDMQKMVGQRLNHPEAEMLGERLRSELGPGYSVSRKVRRSFTPRQLKIVYEVFKNPWLPFHHPRSFIGYHSKQGPSFALNASTKVGQQRTQMITFGGANDGDNLIERFAGYRIGYENVRLGTDRLGLRFDFSTYRTQWKTQTLNALELDSSVPGIYRRRRGLEASVAFAFNPNLYLTAGITANELEMQYPTAHFEPARGGVASLRYRRVFGTGDRQQGVDVQYAVRTGAHSLDSNFIYTRHSFDGRYTYQHDQHAVGFSFGGGRLTGNAPLFERFSLGDTQTLRGWNKYDFAPLGGNRAAHGSLEYRYNELQLFYDAGSVWDTGDRIKVRPSIGIGVGSKMKGRFDNGKEEVPFTLGAFSLILAVPLREAGLQPTIMLVGRFNM